MVCSVLRGREREAYKLRKRARLRWWVGSPRALERSDAPWYQEGGLVRSAIVWFEGLYLGVPGGCCDDAIEKRWWVPGFHGRGYGVFVFLSTSMWIALVFFVGLSI